MPQAESIHIGLNRVDPAGYQGWSGPLSGCLNDARAMHDIADSLGFSSTTLTDAEATSSAVLSQLSDSADTLVSGDILLVTYSGHGGQLPDYNGDEADGQDETWCLFDRELLDDELYAAWGRFTAGVRIVVLSDSCHSGSVTRSLLYRQISALSTMRELRLPSQPTFRSIPEEVQHSVLAAAGDRYRAIARSVPDKKSVDPAATVLLISGCQDNQLSMDGSGNGLFTEKLLAAWDGGDFTGSYADFWRAILAQMPATQSPAYSVVGAAWPQFEAQHPLTIDAPAGAGSGAGTSGGTDSSGTGSSGTDSGGTDGGGTDSSGSTGGAAGGRPSIAADAASYDRSGPAPSFTVDTAGAGFFVVEVAARGELFDDGGHGSERSADAFYATWSDSSAPGRETGSSWTLPDAAWDALRGNDRLVVRVGTTPAEDSWDGYAVSTDDDGGDSAPSLEITGDRALDLTRTRARRPRAVTRPEAALAHH